MTKSSPMMLGTIIAIGSNGIRKLDIAISNFATAPEEFSSCKRDL